MISSRSSFPLAAAALCAQLCMNPGPAGAASNMPVPAPSRVASAHQSSPPPLPPPGLPPLPVMKSPITFFRELLAMNAAERKQALTNRSPESQQRILNKVREYQLLDPDTRELRLQVTELQWYLLPLMKAAVTNRAERLDSIPPHQRKLVEDRLREWDKLPPAVQEGLLENQATIRYLTEIRGLSDQRRRDIVSGISPAQRAVLEKGIARWDAMSSEERHAMLGRFDQFFDLTPAEKGKALKTLSAPERSQIEKTLKTFGSLEPSQRAACIRSFDKFASLSLAERQQFLKNAERWQALTPAERQAWRDVVRTIPPPLPPSLPPLPPGFRYSRPPQNIATNGG